MCVKMKKMRQNAKIPQKQHAMESKYTWNAGEQQENNPQQQLSSNSATQKISLQQHVKHGNAAARRASRPTWRQVLSAPVKRNWSNPARVTCEHRQLPLRGNLPQPHSVVTIPKHRSWSCKKEHAEKHSQIRKNMDPNAARQPPQQRKFHDHGSKIIMLIRDKKLIVKHNDKNQQQLHQQFINVLLLLWFLLSLLFIMLELFVILVIILEDYFWGIFGIIISFG